MKRILSIFLTSVLSLNLLSAAAATPKTDGDGHTLIKLWQDYSKAEAADKPATAAAALQKIKAEAKRSHLTWDYYDAADRYVTVGTRSNWKLRDSLSKAKRTKKVSCWSLVLILVDVGICFNQSLIAT